MKADQSIWLMKCMSLESIQHLMYITAFFLTFSHICFASAEQTKETVFCVHAVLISHYLSSLNLLMMKLDFFGLEHLAVKGQKKSTYLPPPQLSNHNNLSPKILLFAKKWNRDSSKSGQIILLSFAL